jgi:hypothetical protein
LVDKGEKLKPESKKQISQVEVVTEETEDSPSKSTVKNRLNNFFKKMVLSINWREI